MTGDLVVVLRSDDAVSFVADACAALAEAVNQVRVTRASDAALVDVYAEMVLAYSRLRRREWVGDPAALTQLNIVDHLVERLGQARDGKINLPFLDVVDRLHAEITRQPAGV